MVAKAAKTSVIREIQQALRNKDRSAVEITQSYLNAIASREERVGSFITVNEQQALEQVHLQHLPVVNEANGWSCLAALW